MGGFDVDSIRAYHDEQRAAREAVSAPTVRLPRKGDRVRFSIKGKSEIPAREGVVSRLQKDDGTDVVFIRGAEWEFGHWINLDAFDPDSDSVHTAEVVD